MLKHRLTFGPILIGALLGIAWLESLARDASGSGGLVLGPLLGVVLVLATRELVLLLRSHGTRLVHWLSCACVLVGAGAVGLAAPEWRGVSAGTLVASAAVVVVMASLVAYSWGARTDGVTSSVSATLLLFAYPGVLGGFGLLLVREHSVWVVVYVLLLTKLCDIGAYFTGTSIGRHKLIPWLSPGKTWEGLAGGLATSAIAGALGAGILGASPATGAALGAVFGLVGQGGDLVASLLKRDAEVKDFARTLPGFGGIMDVADSPLLVAPVAFWLLHLVGQVGADTAGIG